MLSDRPCTQYGGAREANAECLGCVLYDRSSGFDHNITHSAACPVVGWANHKGGMYSYNCL